MAEGVGVVQRKHKMDVVKVFTEFRWVLPGFTGFCQAFLGCYWVLPSFDGFYLGSWVFSEFRWVLPSFTGFCWILLEFSTSLLGFTGFYWVFNCFGWETRSGESRERVKRKTP